MDSPSKSDFAIMVRDLRVARGLKQRDVAAAIGIAPGTYGNVESAPHKVIRREKAEMLATFYQLAPADRDDLLAAWDRCPLSAYGERQRENWNRRNSMRNKVKMYDKMALALTELLSVHIEASDDGEVCSCSFGSPLCEVCAAMEALGIGPWSGRGPAVRAISDLHAKLAPPAQTGTAS